MMEDETRTLSPLTPDERAEAVDLIGWAASRHPLARKREMARALADKLEAEPEPGVMGNLAASLKTIRAERERDEAQEALRNLLLVIAERSQHPLADDAGARVVEQARAVLKGVERTHTLVPNRALEIIEDRLDDYAGDQLSDGASGQTMQTTLDLVNAVRAAVRGENPKWPS
jgi:hypothetical protein